MAEIVPIIDGAALRKAQLIQDALQTLRASHQIDERDDLSAASFLEWYDRTIPDVRDIKILAGAMEIELARRRGEKILQEEERRGRPEKVSVADTFMSNATKVQRSKERAIATAPEAVTAFIARERAAGRVPTIRAAAGVARAARATAAPQRRIKQAEALQARQSETNEQLFAAIAKVADGRRRTDPQVANLTGYNPQFFLARIRLIPWLRIDRTPAGLAFHIDEELRAICEGRLPRPSLSYESIDHFLRTLRAEITRKRKENRDEREKTRWDSRLILTRVQSDLLDWIEQELDRVPTR